MPGSNFSLALLVPKQSQQPMDWNSKCLSSNRIGSRIFCVIYTVTLGSSDIVRFLFFKFKIYFVFKHAFGINFLIFFFLWIVLFVKHDHYYFLQYSFRICNVLHVLQFKNFTANRTICYFSDRPNMYFLIMFTMDYSGIVFFRFNTQTLFVFYCNIIVSSKTIL